MLVIDTSVAVKWVIPEDGIGIEADTGAALALLADELLAPDCILGEFANALFKKVQRREIGKEQARAAFAILPETIDFFPSAHLVEPALASRSTLFIRCTIASFFWGQSSMVWNWSPQM